MDPLEVLLATELFAGATREELEPLAPALRKRAYTRGAYVFHAGDPVIAAFVVLSGVVKVGVIGPEGHEWVGNLKVQGDSFGEYWLFEESAVRLYDAVAAEHTECLVIAKDTLIYFLEKHPKLMRRLAAALIRRIRTEFQIVVDTQSAGDIADRLTQRLLLLAQAHGERVPRGIRIPIRMSQRMLAAMVRGSRENVNRALARITADGLVAHEDGYITVLQPEKLESSLAGR